MLVGLPAWRKTEIRQPTSISLMFRDFTKIGLKEAQTPPPQRHRSTVKLGRESVCLHCCFGRHVVVIEGYLFVVFCIVHIIVQTILTCRNALKEDGRRVDYTVFTIGPLGPYCDIAQVVKKLQLLGTSSPKPPPELCPWITLAH